MHLYIAYKNYSSWSLRPWLAMKVAGIEFNETLFPFYHDSSLIDFASREGIPARVPVLKAQIDGKEQTIWESLAIMEYLAEQHPALWPEDSALRTLARSASAEMHAGFLSLREEFPMNCRLEKPISPSQATQQDLARLASIWQRFSNTDKPQGPFLCGKFSIADAMYAPVMWRVKTYGLEVSPEFEAWSQAMQALPAMQEWLAAAEAESWQLANYEK